MITFYFCRKIYYDKYSSEDENVCQYFWRQWGKIFCRSSPPSYISMNEVLIAKYNEKRKANNDDENESLLQIEDSETFP